MIEKVRCIDASATQLADVSNRLLKKSKNMTIQAYSKNILSSRMPKFTSETVKQFYNISDFYEKNGDVKEDAKPVFAKVLEDFGLKANATVDDFAKFVLNVYK